MTLHQEMLAHLESCGFDDADSNEIAIYWFASHYHDGQFSGLYSVMSTSPYRPGIAIRLHMEGEYVNLAYRELENFYTAPIPE